MASKNIKGITIEIGGDTTKLQKSLSAISAPISKINKELKDVNQALKLDPKNTELLAQKQDILRRNIEASRDKLNQLKEAQREMGNYASLTDEQKAAYNRLSVEIAKSEDAIRTMNAELKNTNKIDLSKLKSGLEKAGKAAMEVSKAVAASVVAVGVAIGKIMTDAVKSYAEFEQNVGGVETIFGKSAEKVIQNAQKAYQTAGVSANEYMKGVTAFGASLLQATKKDTEKAAKIADMAFQDMADNANKFGTSMDSIQNAYQGFAKQNYTMLDNLKLGYGGTKKEMQRLLKDAQKITGVKYNIKNLADVYQAIHVIQEELGVTGTTAKEASTTITGSLTSMKAAFDNFLNGSGGVEDLSNSITTFLKNVLNAVKKLAPGIISGLVDLFRTLVPELAGMIQELLPVIIDGAKQLIQGLIDFINNDSEQFVNMAVDLLMNLVHFILENLPLLMEASIKIISQIAIGIAQAMPDLIPTIVDCILLMVDTLIDNIDLLVDAAIQLIGGITEGLFKALPELIKRVPEIVIKLVAALIENAPKMLEAAVELIANLVNGLIEGLGSLFDVGIQMVEQLWEGIKAGLAWLKPAVVGTGGLIIEWITEKLGGKKGAKDVGTQTIDDIVSGMISERPKAKDAGTGTAEQIVAGIESQKTAATNIGKQLVNGMTAGIKNKDAQNAAVKAAQSLGNSLAAKLRASLGIASPSKVTAEMGKYLDEGLIKGIEKNSKDVYNQANSFGNSVLSSINNGISGSISMGNTVSQVRTAMKSLTNGVESSVNPVINPTANSNPLYITIDKFYNNRDTDIQQLAEELEFYRKNSALAKGGV